jgi:hypothetical protein
MSRARSLIDTSLVTCLLCIVPELPGQVADTWEPVPKLESDTFNISFPAEYAIDELPQHVEYKYPFASYKSESRAAEHGLHYTRTYELKDIRLPPEQLDDLKTLFRQIADDEHTYTILKSQSSTSSLAP